MNLVGLVKTEDTNVLVAFIQRLSLLSSRRIALFSHVVVNLSFCLMFSDAKEHIRDKVVNDEVMLNVLRCRLTY